MGKLILLSDQPIGHVGEHRNDGLGFKTYAQILSRAIVDTNGPFNIGIFGEWGVGKTSLMKIIQEDLCGSSKMVTVWFNAWRFEKEDHPLIPLVTTIIHQIESHKDVLQKLSDGGKSLVKVLRALVYGFSTKLKIPLPGSAEIETSFAGKDAINRYEKEQKSPLSEKSIYYEAFEQLSDINLEKKIKIVVFIDDLDRCLPDSAIKLLESIKLILSQPGFIFILGMSRSIIEGFLQHRYQIEYGLKHFQSHAYLDKIIQLPFYIPPHVGRMEEFSNRLLDEMPSADKELFKEILPIIGVACSNNPRATIRFVNNLLIDREINGALSDQEKIDKIPIGYFAITRSLQQHWRKMYALLVTSDELCEKIHQWEPQELVTYENSKNRDEADAAAMLTSDRNLRDLLFSSQGRDWLENTEVRKEATQFLRTRHISSEKTGGDEGKQYDIYFCYQGGDTAIVSNIAKILKDNDISVYFIPKTVMNWQEDIGRVVENSKCVALFIGPQFPGEMTVDKDKEIEFVLRALEKESSFRLVPILLPNAAINHIPDKIKRIQALDLREGLIDKATLSPLIRLIIGVF
ncbi:MAG: P-loop NTPase fold protein [Candidatus Aminicenantes bacterium]|jgi:hypothetical protein